MISTPLVFVDAESTRARLEAHLVPQGDCLVWTESTKEGWGSIAVKLVSGGYRYGWRAAGTHVVAYTLAHGPVPAGLVVDHLCRVRACCRVEHLEVITQAENARRANATRGACRKCGADDWMKNGNSRRCRPCFYQRRAEWAHERQAGGVGALAATTA